MDTLLNDSAFMARFEQSKLDAHLRGQEGIKVLIDDIYKRMLSDLADSISPPPESPSPPPSPNLLYTISTTDVSEISSDLSQMQTDSSEPQVLYSNVSISASDPKEIPNDIQQLTQSSVGAGPIKDEECHLMTEIETVSPPLVQPTLHPSTPSATSELCQLQTDSSEPQVLDSNAPVQGSAQLEIGDSGQKQQLTQSSIGTQQIKDEDCHLLTFIETVSPTTSQPTLPPPPPPPVTPQEQVEHPPQPIEHANSPPQPQTSCTNSPTTITLNSREDLYNSSHQVPLCTASITSGPETQTHVTRTLSSDRLILHELANPNDENNRNSNDSIQLPPILQTPSIDELSITTIELPPSTDATSAPSVNNSMGNPKPDVATKIKEEPNDQNHKNNSPTTRNMRKNDGPCGCAECLNDRIKKEFNANQMEIVDDNVGDNDAVNDTQNITHGDVHGNAYGASPSSNESENSGCFSSMHPVSITSTQACSSTSAHSGALIIPQTDTNSSALPSAFPSANLGASTSTQDSTLSSAFPSANLGASTSTQDSALSSAFPSANLGASISTQDIASTTDQVIVSTSARSNAFTAAFPVNTRALPSVNLGASTSSLDSANTISHSYVLNNAQSCSTNTANSCAFINAQAGASINVQPSAQIGSLFPVPSCESTQKSANKSIVTNFILTFTNPHSQSGSISPMPKPPPPPNSIMDTTKVNPITNHNAPKTKAKRLIPTIQCPKCPRTFRKSDSLKAHLNARIHNPERKYICEVCHEEFSGQNVLNQHKKVHDSEKPLQCRICLKEFRWPGNLKQHHQIVHQQMRTYRCNWPGCTYGSNIKAGVRRHVCSQHLKVKVRSQKKGETPANIDPDKYIRKVPDCVARVRNKSKSVFAVKN